MMLQILSCTLGNYDVISSLPMVARFYKHQPWLNNTEPMTNFNKNSMELFATGLQQSPFAIVIFDQNGQIIESNASFQNLLPTDLHPLTGTSIQELFCNLTTERFNLLKNRLTTEDLIESNEVLGKTLKSGHSFSVQIKMIPWNGQKTYAFYIKQASEQQYQFECIQKLQQETLEAVAVGLPLSAIFELICYQVESCAPDVICSIVLVDKEGRIHPAAGPSLPDFYSEALEGLAIGPVAGSCGTSAWHGEPVEASDINTDPLWADYKTLAQSAGLAACWSSPIKSSDGSVLGTFALYYREPRRASEFHRHMVKACLHLCHLAIEHEQSGKRIHKLAFYDPLTGLGNRYLLKDKARIFIEEAKRSATQVAFFFINLDRFKNINDSLGHSLGDALLKTIARRLTANLATNEITAHLGADEFAVLQPHSNKTTAEKKAKALLELLSMPLEINELEFNITACIGISLTCNETEDFETLQRNASAALYHAKSNGLNMFRFFQSDMHHSKLQRLKLETDLQRAIGNQELEVYFQPQIHIESGHLYGVEALLRWHHPNLGMVPPSKFIPLAEECGMICRLDLWVLESACRMYSKWQSQHIDMGKISVNMSAANFYSFKFAESIESTLKKFGVNPKMLTLEITESVLLTDIPGISQELGKLRELGVNLSVDDFGTGYSSLSYLKKLPINEIKLDKNFINDVDSNSEDQALVGSIINIGQILKHTVVAEGVETKEQLQTLKALGCNVAQGYLHARPMPEQALIDWYHQDTAHPLRDPDQINRKV
ncbi:bifunctional diguanylate cyclase/phosphodiesterase [Gynuella sunshinyii]|uniref:cyclic-guanylate-specific phosphodiesterase n=1 Tax=Gynuella sunshinyii YC6258 TaxID=1445510 RepID=A0A0C5V6S0_9GAMM|nr:EAL domain-containing protein [Gynuella sunshinyii]AJQ95130.1 putative signal transduction protein containing a membrane domain, an EAL and a GGDEF domain [Gynuella sunshinyii YC6258]